MSLSIEVLAQQVEELWQAHGGPCGPIRLQPGPPSGNNRIFIATGEDRRIIAKVYFTGQNDGCTRMENEWNFVRHIHGLGIDSVPAPVARLDRAGLALYQFIDGCRLTADELTDEHVAEAARFIVNINQAQGTDTARVLRPAREACFTVAEHFAVIERRLARLDTIMPDDHLDRGAIALAHEMRAFWLEFRQRLTTACSAMNIDPAAPVDEDQRLLSPSDFGFHNALARPGGRLTFIDFEYAGWDDLAKLVADFFYQPGVPVPRRYLDVFIAPLLARLRRPDLARWRFDAMRPLFGLKWCCIMLNCFLPDMAMRVQFADPLARADKRKRTQLDKASTAFAALRAEF